jgi:L-lyxonate dehydratase
MVPQADVPPRAKLQITGLRARAIGWSRSPKTLQANMMSPTRTFPDHESKGRTWWGPAVMVLVEVTAANGLTGIGTAGGFSPVPKAVIDHHFRNIVIGENALDVELIWSKLYRSSVRFGRSGAVIAAISAIDIACHDLIGKTLGVPVYDLLGGRTKPRIPVYASRLYALEDLDELAEEARTWKRLGFTTMKQRFGFGPRDGVAGMKRNVELIHCVRDVIGDEIELAADAYMGWDVDYALAMVKRLEPFDLKWIEEPLMPHDLAGYARLRTASSIRIAAGEHEYTRYGFANLIDSGAIDFLQPDISRMGGFTEARRVWALAAARDLPVIPHSNEAHHLHMVMSQMGSPMAEYFPNVEPDTGNELFWKLFVGDPEAVQGGVDLSDRPGLGIEINEPFAREHTIKA